MAKEPNYISNKLFLQEIIKSKEQDKLTKPAEEMFMLLGKRVIKKMSYRCNADRDDVYQAGMLALLLGWRSFNEEKSTAAFAFFTEVFKRGIAKGFNQLFVKKGDLDKKCHTISLDAVNGGGGMFNL